MFMGERIMENKICFVVMGFGNKTDYSTGKTYDLDKTYKNIIKPVAEECGYKCVRSDEIKDSSLIDRSMYGLLLYADLVIADISTYNPNAIYELGIRHAVKPFHTIILKESNGELPFDLSHTKIYSYCHLGEDIGVDESKRCVEELTQVIKSIKDKDKVDSPFYEYINSVKPPKISEEEIEELIGELITNNDTLFAIVEEAKLSKRKNNFKKAAECWKIASEKMPNEEYYIQQQALCTYKSKWPSEKSALNNALIIINKLINKDDSMKTDPETLGIAGAIYKNMFFNNKDMTFLDKAIDYYGNGFNIRKDYYTGENYALCLNIKASLISDSCEKIYFNVRAKKIRNEIIQILTNIIMSGDLKERDDRKWIYATLANCYFAVNDKRKASEFEHKFKQESDAKWEIDTYLKNKSELLKIIGGK